MLAAVLAENRRSAYRVRPIATDNLEIILLRNEERYTPFEIADVTCKGASIRFTKGASPRVGKGEEIQVLIDTPYLPGGATLRARVVFSGDSTTEHLIGLAFIGAEALVARAGENFFELFNRRVAYRDTDPSPVARLSARLGSVDGEPGMDSTLAVTVRNLSATGICLVADPAADEFLQQQSSVRLMLVLPGGCEESEVVARVCYRSVVDSKVYFGCHFDWQETEDSGSVLEAITQYTIDRFDEDHVLVNH